MLLAPNENENGAERRFGKALHLGVEYSDPSPSSSITKRKRACDGRDVETRPKALLDRGGGRREDLSSK